jgi:hypothetical protein
MTEAEALEVAGIHVANGITAFSIYITFTLAYLVASYHTGSKLSSFQIVTVSILYIFAALSSMLSLINSVLIFGQALEMTTMSSITPFAGGKFWAIGMTSLMTSGILVSLVFMWSVRHPKTE